MCCIFRARVRDIIYKKHLLNQCLCAIICFVRKGMAAVVSDTSTKGVLLMYYIIELLILIAVLEIIKNIKK